jgi:DNA-binding transcriptional MocR family regulator
VDAARRRGVALDGVNEHAAAPTRHGIVLGFATAPEATLRRGARLLCAARDDVMSLSH